MFDKVKFFISRVFSHGIFLSIPFWVSFFDIKSEFLLVNLALCYFLFLCFHWLILGREINYRLKVYTRSNSSVDRILERLIIGAATSIMLVNLISLLPFSLEAKIYSFFWILWIVCVSWPTSKKMIDRKISNEFSELKFLNGFEKLSLATITLYLFASYPSFPKFNGSDSVRIYFDSKERFHDLFWNFIDISLFYGVIPDDRIHSFFYVFLYFFIMLFTLTAMYATFRYFCSRNLSFLGTVTFIATWSISVNLNSDMYRVYSSGQYILLYWTILWVYNSSSYRSGFLLGAALFIFSLINPSMIVYQLPLIIILMLFLGYSRSRWYQGQLMKYLAMGGVFLGISLFTYHGSLIGSFNNGSLDALNKLVAEISLKSIYLLFLPGIFIWILKCFKLVFKRGESVEQDLSPLLVFICFVYSFLISCFLDNTMFESFALIGVICFVSISSLKIIFQKLYEYKSQKNLVFCLYLLICLLDSRLEERVKILLENF